MTKCKLLFLVSVVLLSLDIAQAQNNINTTLDPAEARALNTIFSRWGLSPVTNGWNISGELCSGVALGDSPSIDTLNPAIKCDCPSDNTNCHISALRVFELNVSAPLPDELWNLTYLINVNLIGNYLTGTIPPAIGNLIRMRWLTVSANSLSGQLPAELGLLTDLRFLGFSGNNFSGSLPPEMGNLTRLTRLYINGNEAITGPIHQTFANIRLLEILWILGTGLTGPIPDFIGNFSNLRDLRLRGNSFQGPIPASFAGLINLNTLRISDLLPGNYSLDLDTFRNMANLTNLVLRNNGISDAIPSFFSGFQSLSLLDLSFNNLVGAIPDALMNINNLSTLFLGNNMLTGMLPSRKAASLLTIDLSYNQLSGAFPSWITDTNLQLNLVANNFNISDSNSSNLPSGLNCLQRNFPCNRGQPIYSSFAINCGGQEITSNGRRIVYDRDNETLGPATYYQISTGRWAVSNVGLSPQYIAEFSSEFTNTLDSSLFHTSRLSAGSLRYYGLSLENGNYTVSLQFGEAVSVGPNGSWLTIERRVFDIYIQGNLEVQDFNLHRESGGVPRRALVRSFTTQVSENYLEIHLFWAGKGTTNIPDDDIYGPLVSAISATLAQNIPPGANSTGLVVGVVVGVGLLVLISLSVACFLFQKRKRQKKFEDEELFGVDSRPYTYSYAELKTATNNFNPSNKLGEGGFGPVYKGTLEDGREVAVKQLSMASHQGKTEFVAEIATISAVQHRNLVRLYGCCIERKKRLLVYEYLKNKSLDKVLFGIDGTGKDKISLDWSQRYDICLGVARGLAYLHEESRIRIVHRDVKASNILLDSDLVPKISDFGLAKLYDDKMTHISTRIAGTVGYLAPEYALRGHLTEKADVFSFGILALEIISGRPNTESSLVGDDKIYLLDRVWNLHESNTDYELVDPILQQFDETEVKRIIDTALLCTQPYPNLRPSMSRAVAMLSGDIEITPISSRPNYLYNWNKFTDTTTDNYGSTTSYDTSHITSSTSSTMVVPPQCSPPNPSQPMLPEQPFSFIF